MAGEKRDQVVTTQSGQLRGRAEGRATVFRNVPYAAAPLGALRFAPPQPAPAWQGVRDASADGPIAPQGRSRLAHVMGDFEREQGEDCLSLTIWRPGEAKQASPVLVWLHGGAYTSGAGSLAWYSGEAFAAQGGLVVVDVNYRLGALGFLYRPGVSGGNLGLLDQVAALRWVRDNIRNFGGDPGNVTVVGQSAGGGSIASLLAMPQARGLFHRAVLQSPPLGRLARTAERAAAGADRFLDILKIDRARPERLRDVPVRDLLAAQGQLAREQSRFADAEPPWGPVIDGTVIASDPLAAIAGGAAAGIDIMIGTTREEMAAFYGIDEAVRTADAARVDEVFASNLGPDYGPYLDEYRRMRGSRDPAILLGDLVTDRMFRMPSIGLAESLAATGNPAYLYQFDWQSPAGFAACHCLEIPFIFDNFADWPDAPMLKGAAPEELAPLTAAMHGAWTAFARTGDPNHDAMPPWERYEPKRRMTMRFDTLTDQISDLAGLAWRRPQPR